MLPNFCPYLRQILTYFQNSFTVIVDGKFAVTYIPPLHLTKLQTKV